MDGGSGPAVVTAPPTSVPHFDRVVGSPGGNLFHNLRQDFNMMEQRKRVSMILQSPAFCEELESLIQDQLNKGKDATNLLALQQMADFLTTSMPTVYPMIPRGGMATINMSLGMVIPVNDLRGSASVAYEKGEKLMRSKLAALYRLADLFGWSQLIYNHLTVRLSSEQEHFLVAPFGLLYSEVTASSLVKVDMQGEIVDRGSTNLGVNQAGFTLHSAIYAARPDVKCIVHIHTAAGAAVSAMKFGLLPISPEALSLGEVAYHDYHGILVDKEMTLAIQNSLGPKKKVLILRNYGLLSIGETVEEAFHYIHNLATACEIQVRTLAGAGGPDNLVTLDPEKYKAKRQSSESGDEEAEGDQPRWQVGEQQFEAFMRMLDNLGYRTGYPYRCPALCAKSKKNSSVDMPLALTGRSYSEINGPGTRSLPRIGGASRRLSAGSSDGGPGSRVWNNVTRGHVKPLLRSLSSGVCVPSCMTTCLWSKEEGARPPAVSNQFVPLNTDPKEVLEMRNKIREQNLQDIKTAGPQSQVLSGPLMDHSFGQRGTIWQDAPLSDCTDTLDGLNLSEHVRVPARADRKGELVTASKAIIEKEYQPKVIINKTGPNPFNRLTDQELEEYCKEVQRKQKCPEDQSQEMEEDSERRSLSSSPIKEDKGSEDGDDEKD
nr:alpha-adducin-like isoform X1 [Paramormyrops kingsleyae]XP_023657859.1 alpha-adducin-like isoform X1 [Paramormyrops kingsleyae]XP_023657868.1 alpha-adducin-like isoform X1 [Paramormyrops kingsleyae]XP_023657878.1 alpha-adducin-like isoform X1 [Paramormyrops kingsleyae]